MNTILKSTSAPQTPRTLSCTSGSNVIPGTYGLVSRFNAFTLPAKIYQSVAERNAVAIAVNTHFYLKTIIAQTGPLNVGTHYMGGMSRVANAYEEHKSESLLQYDTHSDMDW